MNWYPLDETNTIFGLDDAPTVVRDISRLCKERDDYLAAANEKCLIDYKEYTDDKEKMEVVAELNKKRQEYKQLFLDLAQKCQEQIDEVLNG